MAELRYRFRTLEIGDQDIHLRSLRDRQQFDDPEGLAESLGICSASWPMFGVLWAAGELLARMMQDYDIRGLRILEVGCGLGLSSLLLNQRLADITASDHHPSANALLQYNARLNNGRVIPFFRGSWADSNPALGEFDLIIGSDLLYEPDHAALLAGFIDRHASPHSRAIIVDAGRGNRPAFCRQMDGYGFSHSCSPAVQDPAMPEPFKGQVMRFARGAGPAAG